MQAVLEKPAELIITPVSESYIETIRTLAHAIWPEAYEGILTPEQIANMLEKIYAPENLKAEMADGHRFWIAYNDQLPVGYCSAYQKSGSVWIKKIYVKQRGRGIGRQLMDIAEKAFPGMTDLRLLVNPHNIPAQRFYSHMGFTKIGEVPVRMGDWEFNDHLYSRPVGSL